MPWIPTAKPPIQSSPPRIDEVGEAHVGPPFPLLHLLAEERQADLRIPGQRHHIVAVAAAAPQADHAARLQPMFGDDPVEHLLRIGEQAARAFADDRVVEDRGIIARQLPRAEEGRPVDMRLQVAQRPFAEMVEPGLQRRRRLALGIEREAIGAGFVDARQFVRAAARAGDPQRLDNRWRSN